MKLSLAILRSTEDAILVTKVSRKVCVDPVDLDAQWLPLSQVKVIGVQTEESTRNRARYWVEVPKWLIAEKGLAT